MKISHLYLISALCTIAGYICYKINQKKDAKESKKDYSEIDLSREYIFVPNWKKVKITLLSLAAIPILIFFYSFSEPNFDTFLSRILVGFFAGFFTFFLWGISFIRFNSEKIVFADEYLDVYSFISQKPIRIHWSNVQKVEYLLQNDKIRFLEKQPSKNKYRVGLMHYSSESQDQVKALLDANLQKHDKNLLIKYW